MLGLFGFVAATDESLDCVQRAFWVGPSLTPGDVANKAVAIVGKAHHRRCSAGALIVGDDRGFPMLDDGYARIGCAQVDT